ncbi:HAD-IA family hydrolase [Gammaproteobacteria bacterium]|nr:HAD-IA family hydrolase [Gammaproteobacteria bacterium]
MKTLIFDCDGVLSDTEQHGHLPAFNQMFAEFGLPVQWSVAEYGKKLAIGGGKERMRSLLTPEFVELAGLPVDEEGQVSEIARWHKRKTEIYTQMVADGLLPPRPGIRRIILEALEAGWTLAAASTSAQVSVEAILTNAIGAENVKRFAIILAGDVVANKKPAPDIYQLAIKELNADPNSTLVVEDSRNGLMAAHGAGLNCLVTVSGYTENENFSESVLVVSELGDPGSSIRVLSNLTKNNPENYIGLEDLSACMPEQMGE